MSNIGEKSFLIVKYFLPNSFEKKPCSLKHIFTFTMNFYSHTLF